MTAGELDITADSTETANANNVSAAIGAAFAVNVTTSTATIDSDTEAFTGTRAGETPTAGAKTTITLTDVGNGDGTAVIHANGSRTTTASAKGGSGSFGITVNVFTPTADTSGSVRAYAGEGTVLTADDLTITADAPVMKADSDVFSIGIAGFASVSVLTSVAKVTGEVEAFIGAQADSVSTPAANPVITISGAEAADGDVVVDADTFMNAIAEVFGGGASLGLTVGVSLPEARVDGATRAYVRDGADLTSDTLAVEAGNSGDRVKYEAKATTFSLGFGCSAASA